MGTREWGLFFVRCVAVDPNALFLIESYGILIGVDDEDPNAPFDIDQEHCKQILTSTSPLTGVQGTIYAKTMVRSEVMLSLTRHFSEFCVQTMTLLLVAPLDVVSLIWAELLCGVKWYLTVQSLLYLLWSHDYSVVRSSSSDGDVCTIGGQ